MRKSRCLFNVYLFDLMFIIKFTTRIVLKETELKKTKEKKTLAKNENTIDKKRNFLTDSFKEPRMQNASTVYFLSESATLISFLVNV